MIRIAHLYPYELDLYGENGNIKALLFMLEKANIKYKVDLIDVEDKINFDEYDFIYIGSGRKSFLDLVKKRLEPYKYDIIRYISSDKIMLVTGNAVSVFDFLDFYKTKYLEKRCVSNASGTTSICKGLIKGFQNTEYLIENTDNILFQLEVGVGNQGTKMEGYQNKNFYATSMIGPILARNDNLCKYFVEELKKLEE